MKLHKKITVAAQPYPLVSEAANLNLFTPGRAVFTVQADQAVAGIVIFSAGYNPDQVKPWFIGYVETSTQVDNKQQRIFCRELTAVLFPRRPLALRDVNLKQILAAITQATTLEFVLPATAKTYTSQETAAFYNLANGYHAMDSLGGVFDIEKLLWQQQVDGKVWVGSWNDSHWATKSVDIPRTWETNITSANGATVPALPALRPGAIYNGKVLTGVEFSGVQMKLTWAANPWANR